MDFKIDMYLAILGKGNESALHCKRIYIVDAHVSNKRKARYVNMCVLP
jgi:hypothetical protein